MKLVRTLGLLFVVWWVGAAQAHLMSADRATFNIREDAGYMVLSIPTQFFQGLPIDDQGMLAAQSLEPYRAQIDAQIRNALELTHDTPQQRGVPISAEMIHMTASVAAHAPLTDQILVFLRFAWPTSTHIPSGLHLHTKLWSKPAPQQLEIDVMQDGGPREKYWLNAHNPDMDLLPSTGALMGRFVRLGVTHILEGLDHLLFLFLLLISKVSWRRWLVVLSGFTLAHACTYAAVMQGLVIAPSAWVETLIACTIGWSAMAILRRHHASMMTDLAITCVFGLIHGAGFASAVGDQGRSLRAPVLSLLSFNLGIEFGQIALALVLAMVLQLRPLLVRHGWQTRHDIQLKTCMAAASLLVASIWVVQRWGH